MTGKLKAGVIGVGILGGQHADFYHRNPDVELAGLADARIEVAEAKAAETGARAYGSAEEMVERERPDVVSIATPDPLHRAPFLAAMEAIRPLMSSTTTRCNSSMPFFSAAIIRAVTSLP